MKKYFYSVLIFTATIATTNATAQCSDSFNSFSVSACETYTVPSGDETYSSSGTYMDTIPNLAGCDSVLTINLTIYNPTFSVINPTVCDTYTVPSGDETYTVSGMYMDTIPNSNSCDSVITINLTVNYSTNYIHTATSCISYSYNTQTYTSSGTYTQTLTNSVGCDSVITLNLTIHEVDIDVTQNGSTFSAAPTGVWFQWLDCNNGMAAIPGAYNIDFTPGVDGDYAVHVMTLFCSDTSICYSLDGVGIEESNSGMMAIYPNPSTGEFTISFAQPVSNASLRLIDFSGKTLAQYINVNGSVLVFNMEDQASGIYFVEVNAGGTIQRMKVVKN